MRALFNADTAIVAGFSMSDFDVMAQMQFAEVARARAAQNRPLNVIVIDPKDDASQRSRFERVFRQVTFINQDHKRVDWNQF